MEKTLDWKEYEKTAIQAIAEGCVLLENKNNALPLKKGEKIAVFGRIQNNYYKSGTGSGGKVNVSKVYNIVEGLEKTGFVEINKRLQKIYSDWEKENPYDEGLGWGKERWSQEEMPLSKETAGIISKESQTAIVIIGRTAGEDRDNSEQKGSYLLSEGEETLLKTVRQNFAKMIVLLNTGNIIDMNFVQEMKPDAVMYVWQGGMLGGLGTAEVLTGKVNACGKLTDTIAKKISDYTSDKNFGDLKQNIYEEDIFVGYRYFETFAKDRVLYPFGFGLSYTNFQISAKKAENDEENQTVKISVEVKNIGKLSGKETVQIYVRAPDGRLGKADKVLAAFKKTKMLESGETQQIDFEIPYENFASYDDSGITGCKDCWVLEKGLYIIFAGNSVRCTEKCLEFSLENQISLKKCSEALYPTLPFKRLHSNGTEKPETENVPLRKITETEKQNSNRPKEIKQTENKNIKLKDVYLKKNTMDEFIAQLTDDDLSCIIRGEGMGSSLVTPGTASAYGGVSPRLRETFGIPAACCDDGPSGMRLDCGIKAFSLPNGTSLACTFNEELITKLYSLTALEMANNKVDNLLGPGMNIHRHPLNGRNFEYFSEDPFVTGQIGTAMLKGLKQNGAGGTIKHFCANNQETQRHFNNSVVSARALREIYLKGFEIAVKSGYSDSIMTTYGLVNGIYTSGRYDLNTEILRNDWNFKGIVMTDWWAHISSEKTEPSKTDFASMIHAQNDLYMVCSSGAENKDGDNTLESLNKGELSRAELQRSAKNICGQIMNTFAMQRTLDSEFRVKIINKPKESDDINLDEIEFKVLDKNALIDLTYQKSKAGSNYILAFDVQNPGTYEVTLTASSELNNLAQLPNTLFLMGIPIASFVFQGSEGKEISITKKIVLGKRFSVSRLFCAADGLNLKSIELKYLNDNTEMNWIM